ncbi:MAG TPA: hypothetical protein VKZ53_23435 [Candidatus Angelobacter sp.]|nr:hypothetical protein [Candidatus Angelobacter sp.]
MRSIPMVRFGQSAGGWNGGLSLSVFAAKFEIGVLQNLLEVFFEEVGSFDVFVRFFPGSAGGLRTTA